MCVYWCCGVYKKVYICKKAVYLVDKETDLVRICIFIYICVCVCEREREREKEKEREREHISINLKVQMGT